MKIAMCARDKSVKPRRSFCTRSTRGRDATDKGESSQMRMRTKQYDVTRASLHFTSLHA